VKTVFSKKKLNKDGFEGKTSFIALIEGL